MNVKLLLSALLLGTTALTASARPVIGLTDNNELVHFDSASPGTIVSTVPIRGIFGSSKVESIDIRPHDGLLYGLAISAPNQLSQASVTLYAINPLNGIATLVDNSISGMDPAPLRYGFDFDPANDVLRVVNAADQNRRLDFHSAVFTGDTNLGDGNNATPERILAIAYDRNDSSAGTATTLYGINFDTDQLVRIGGVDGQPSANGGLVTPIGGLGFQTDALEMGFDIAQDGIAYASLVDGTTYGLYTINLSTGSATLVGAIGDGTKVIRGIAVPFDASLPAPTFVVLNTNDKGADSLHEQILRSNAHPGKDTITFAIPGAGPHVIQVGQSSLLPPVYDAVIIDGTTEPDFDAATRQPVVVLDFAVALNGSNPTGLLITEEFAHGTEVRGLRVTNFIETMSFTGTGIRVNSDNVILTGNYIGTDGSTAFRNGGGVHISGKNCVLGGTSAADRNVISGNFAVNVVIGAAGAQVLGNYIGTNAAGTAAVPGSSADGLVVTQGAGAQVIGGAAPGARNVISGNKRGLQLRNSAAVIAGNYIGTNAAGDAAVPNDVGIEIIGNGGHTIGTAGEGRNVISGNKTSGVSLLAATQGNALRNNFIGVTVAGAALGNGGAGVRIAEGSMLNSIGAAGAGNVIGFNTGAGVAVLGDTTTLNTITSNSMFSNGGLGIDLGDNGVTANDNGDADAGPNALQNFPVLTSAANKGNGTILIEGSLNSIPNVTYRIELYTTDAVDPSGNGEGRTSLGSFTAMTDGTGNLTFSQSFPVAPGGFATATAEAAGSTSEFSPAIPIAGPKPGVLANISTRLRVGTGDNVLIGGFIITGMQPKKVIVRAIGPSAGVGGALADPQMEIYNSNDELVAANNNWRDNLNAQEISDSTLAPNNDLEAAVLGSLAPGAYTAVVSGVNGGTGVGLVEAYDLDQAANARLANISTRGFVQTGDDVLIGGLIITGEVQLKAILRALGPSLDVSGKLADPTLELFNANGDSLAFNNNWRDTQEAEVNETTIPPSNDLEAAIVASLPPANYTAILRGVNDTTGIGVVEIYALSP